MGIDVTKPVRTKAGEPATIVSTRYCSYAGGMADNLGVIVHREDCDVFVSYDSNGKFWHDSEKESEHDLENIPENVYYYFNVYAEPAHIAIVGAMHDDLKAATKARPSGFRGHTYQLTIQDGKVIDCEIFARF